MPIALATCAALPELDVDDQLLLMALRQAGVDARPVIWSDASVDWSQYALVLIRSTWDYCAHYTQYLDWTTRVEHKTRLLNPASLIRWNGDKRYLRELSAAGVPIIPTVWVEQADDDAQWRQALAQINQEQMDQFNGAVVIKPSISASGVDTYCVEAEDLLAARTRFNHLLPDSAVMIQPYCRRIEREGEYSLIFLEGKLCHVVRKLPASGEFRIQEHLGGRITPFSPTPEMVQTAQAVLAALKTCELPQPHYARVDLVRSNDGNLCLSELEALEPSLYLKHAPETVDRWVGKIQACLQLTGNKL